MRLNLLKDKLLKQLEEMTIERDHLQRTDQRLEIECNTKAKTIAVMEVEEIKARATIAENNELISKLQVRRRKGRDP